MSYGKEIRCIHCGYEEGIKFTGNEACGIYFLYWDEKTGKYRNGREDTFLSIKKTENKYYRKEEDKYYGRKMREISYYELENYMEKFRCPKCKKIGFKLNGIEWID